MSPDRSLAFSSALTLGSVAVLGAILAIVLGHWIAEENWFLLGVVVCVGLGAFLILRLRDNWWVLIPWMGAIGFSTTAPGFNLTGVDAAALLCFVIIAFRRAVGDIRPARPPITLNWVFVALTLYVLIHALMTVIYHHYDGGTQVKNVVKAYYQIAAPLLLVWLLTIYATPSSVRIAVFGMLLISVSVFCVGCTLVYLQIDIPGLSNPLFNFDWAGAGALGYIRWSSCGLLLVALCLSTVARSAFPKAACLLIVIVALVGAFLGGGRVALAGCLLALALWMGLRRNLLPLILIAPVALVALLAINADPQILKDLPKTVQRSLTPFVLSEHRTEEQRATELSDMWHSDLRKESWDYWIESPIGVVLGHGYKGWNDSIDLKSFTEGPLYESAKKTAIQMGRTERAFSSILVILGAVGVLLYFGLMLFLVARLWRLRLSSFPGSFSRAMCEFSLCMVLVSLVTSFHAGGVPSYPIITWFFGLLASREPSAVGAPASVTRRKGARATTVSVSPAKIGRPASFVQ